MKVYEYINNNHYFDNSTDEACFVRLFCLYHIENDLDENHIRNICEMCLSDDKQTINLLRGIISGFNFYKDTFIWEFCGGGDSGELDKCSTYMDGLSHFTIYCLEEFIRSYISDYDWWNNEGGNVKVILSIPNMTMECNYELAVTKYEYETVSLDLCQ